MTLEENKAVVRRLWDGGWRAHVINEVCAPNYVLHSGGRDDDREGVTRGGEALYTAMPDLAFNIEDLMAVDDRVIARVLCYGTHTGEFRGAAPTDKKITFVSINISRIKDSKIVEMWEEWDVVGFMRQMGVLPPE